MQNQELPQSLNPQSQIQKVNQNDDSDLKEMQNLKHIQQSQTQAEKMSQDSSMPYFETDHSSNKKLFDQDKSSQQMLNKDINKSKIHQYMSQNKEESQKIIEDLRSNTQNLEFKSLQNIEFNHSLCDIFQDSFHLNKSLKNDQMRENFNLYDNQDKESYFSDSETFQSSNWLPFQHEYSQAFKNLQQIYQQKHNEQKVELNLQISQDKDQEKIIENPTNYYIQYTFNQKNSLDVDKNSIDLSSQSSYDQSRESQKIKKSTQNDFKISYNINIVPAHKNTDDQQQSQNNQEQSKQQQYQQFVIQVSSDKQDSSNSNNAGRQSLIVQNILKNNTINQANLLTVQDGIGSLNQFGKSFNKLSIDLGIQKSMDLPSQILSSQNLQGSEVFKTESQINLYKQNLKMIEKIKIHNKSLKLDLKDPEISDILQKNGKISHEIKFLQKCIEGMPLFQKHQGLFEKANTSHHLFSQIKHIKYSKNHVIFNFGSVSCLIPQNQYKEELIQEQKNIEFMQQRIQKIKNKPPAENDKQENNPQFIDIVMQAFKQKQQSDYLTLLKSQGKPVPNVSISSRRKFKPQQTPENLTPEVLKQNQLFNQYLQKRGMNKQQEVVEKSSFLRRKSQIKLLDGKRKSKQDEDISKSKPKPPQTNQNFLTVQKEIESPKSDTQEKQVSNSSQAEQKIEETKQITYTIETKQETFQEHIQKQFPKFFPVKTFVAGESFGEIALMTKERRTATMVCQEETHLMVLSKEGFDKIIGSFQQQILREKLEFLRRFQFLDSLPTSQLMSLLHYFKINNLTQKTVVYNEGDEADNIYFIKTGEVEVLKKVIINDQKYIQSQKGAEELTRNLIEMNISLKNKIKQKKTETMSIKLLGSGQCFGEEEIIEEKHKRLYKVVVTQQAEIFSISKEVKNSKKLLKINLLIKIKKHILTSLKSQKGLSILQKQKQVKQNWINERENFISTKKVETNKKLSDDMKIFEKNRQKKLEYLEIQRQIYENQAHHSPHSEQNNRLNSSYSSHSSNSRFKQSPCSSPQRSSSENHSDVSSPSLFSSISQKNYPMMDSLKLNESSDKFEQNYTPRLKYSQMSEQSSSPSSWYQQKNKHFIDHTMSSYSQNQEFKEDKNLRIKNLQQDLIKRTPQINRILNKHQTHIPTISLSDLKHQSPEHEFNLNSKAIEIQEMTSRSKRDNYNLLIKNKNQIVEQNHDINDREKIQVDLFREIKKKKYSSFNNNHNNNNNNGSGLKKGDESQISNFSNCQVPKEKLSDQHSSFQRGYNSSSKLREMQTRTQSSTFYNNWHTNTKVKDYSQIQNNNLGSVNEKAKENLRELSSINLNETAFRSKEVQQRNQFNSLSPHSLQQHLKKGTIMNVIKQCQSTQNINQKHITEFTKEIRNKLQNKNLSRKELSQKYLKKQNRISFISQIDFNNILNDNSSITQQEIANQLPQFSSNQQQSEFPNLNQDRQSFQQDNNDNIDNSKFYQTQYKNYSTINQDSFQINDSFSSSMGNGFRYNKEFNRSRMGKQRITLSPQNQKNENQSKDFSQNNFHCSQIRGLNSRQSSTEKSILNPHSSAQNYTFETIVNNNEKKMKDLSKEKRSSLNLDQYKSMTQKEQQHQSQSYNKILNSKIQFKNNNFNIMTDSQQFKQAHKVNQNSLSALNDDLKLSKQQNQFSYNPFQHSDQKKNVFSLNGIDKNIIKTFKLDKIIQNDYEKSFIKLAQTCSQHIKEIKQIDKFQINSNSVKQNHTQIQSAIVRNRHNQRLVDLCNLKKRINMSTIQKESNINNTNINNSVNEQNSRKKLDGYYSEQQQPDQSKLDISLLQNLHIQQAQIQKNKPS